jgi:hypothetical protein
MADFKLDVGDTADADGTRTGWRKVDYSPAHEWAAVVYRNDDRSAVAGVSYADLRSEGKRPMSGSQGARIQSRSARGLRAALC